MVIGNFASNNSFSIIVCGISVLIAIVMIAFLIVHWIKEIRVTSIERKINQHLHERDFMRVENHGTSINESFGKDFKFVDYFEDSKYE